jgi:hypothetical protein
MKHSAFNLTILLLVPFFYLVAQERIDVICLKNGDILKGTIIEQFPNDSLHLQLKGGSVLTVMFADIQKMTKEKPASAEPYFLHKSNETPVKAVPQIVLPQENEKKSTSTAVVLSIFLTSSGHAYAGNWGRGLLFTAGRVSGVVLALTAGIQTTTYSTPNPYGYSWDYYYSSTEITSWYYIGLGTTLVFSVWEALDAAGEVERYNNNLAGRSVSGKQYGLNIVPGKYGPLLQLSCKF